MKTWLHTFCLGAGFGAAFLAGRLVPSGTSAVELAAQGRGPVNPPPAPAQPEPVTEPAPVVYTEGGGQGVAANGFLAVTGSYGVGTSVVYVIDTVNRQLAVYEARGGSAEQRRVVLVGARRIDLDLQLEGYNDRSEYEYRRLKDLFGKRGSKDVEVRTGLEPEAGSRK
ncbi:MAG: hypothetical protein JNK78_17100 [Planctomycetes bacterium]|nr:hypothetical protein [Planctomycetota bacterium]